MPIEVRSVEGRVIDQMAMTGQMKRPGDYLLLDDGEIYLIGTVMPDGSLQSTIYDVVVGETVADGGRINQQPIQSGETFKHEDIIYEGRPGIGRN